MSVPAPAQVYELLARQGPLAAVHIARRLDAPPIAIEGLLRGLSMAGRVRRTGRALHLWEAR